jgi:hypothetical protein
MKSTAGSWRMIKAMAPVKANSSSGSALFESPPNSGALEAASVRSASSIV